MSLLPIEESTPVTHYQKEHLGGATTDFDFAMSTDQDFNTILKPTEASAFSEWKSKNAPNDSGEDYDLRGAFKDGLSKDSNGHFSDKYKKPNHPTFSNESIYASYGTPGHWDGENFIK